jgi:Icc-related predicted phosphoesterase
MRVAAIYDIHANLPALEAVLEEIRQAEIDHIVVGGDVLPLKIRCTQCQNRQTRMTYSERCKAVSTAKAAATHRDD